METIFQGIKRMVRATIRRTLPKQIKWFSGREMSMTSEEWSHVHLSFSQYGEDLLVWELLRREGRTTGGVYVDIGAFDPILYSNTNLLHRRGWKGLNIDLNDAAIVRFDQLRPLDANLNCAVSREETEMVLCKYSSASTNRLMPLAEVNRRSLLGEEPRETKVVKTLPLSKILERHLPSGDRFDFLDIDCEGHDLEVLKSNDWSKHRPFVLAVEDLTNEPHSETVCYCEEQGYDLVATLFITRIFLDRTASDETKATYRVNHRDRP